MDDIWNKVKTALKARIPGHSYQMWIEPVAFVRKDADTVVLSCPNFFSRKRVQDQYGIMIEAEFLKILGHPCKLTIEISEKERKAPGKSKKAEIKTPDPQLALPEVATHQAHGRILRRDFTFDRFVVGNNNSFAYSAALSVASQRDVNQSSLFLLSETGLGKSHLSQAVGHHILKHCPNEKLYYITAEEFANEMVQAFRNSAIDQFKEKYRRQCDVLLLEDVHFLTGKDRTQTELALALDYLLNADKRIIFTSCYLPGDIPKINEQLKSRFSSGLISGIEPPDFQTRLRILQQKVKENGYKLPRPIAEYLAGELSENVRQLESGLIGVTARSALTGSTIDLSMAESVVRSIAGRSRTITVDTIKEMVCRHYNVTTDDIISKSRKKAIVRPRQVAIYLARKYTDQPLQVISRSFNRYHATAIHSIAAVEKDMKSDPALRKQIEILTQKLESDTSS